MFDFHTIYWLLIALVCGLATGTLLGHLEAKKAKRDLAYWRKRFIEKCAERE